MDFNGFLLSAMLIRGRFDTETIHENRFRVYMNQILAFIQLFCAFKMLIVLLTPWNEEAPILFYLVEFFIYRGEIQTTQYVSVFGIHLNIAYIYWEWGQLSTEPKRLHYLKMLFMDDVKQLCQYYGLPLKETRKFVQRFNIFGNIMIFFVIGFEVCFLMVVGRCLYFAMYTLPPSHFYSISIPMGAITLFGYHWLANGFLMNYLVALVTISFLGLRINTISDRIKRKFGRIVQYRDDRIVLLKGKKEAFKMMETINDIVKQFNETNLIFDRSSMTNRYQNRSATYSALHENFPKFLRIL